MTCNRCGSNHVLYVRKGEKPDFESLGYKDLNDFKEKNPICKLSMVFLDENKNVVEVKS